MRKVECRQQGPPAKKGETGRGIGGADLVTMYEKEKNTIVR